VQTCETCLFTRQSAGTVRNQFGVAIPLGLRGQA
jgi:hypothetical protein